MATPRVNALTLLCTLATTVGLLPAVRADEFQSLAQVEQTAETWAYAQLQDRTYSELSVAAGPLDNRLRLKACDQALEAFGTVGNARTSRLTVGIRCGSPAPWTLYVPVQIRASVAVVALASAQPKGTVLRRSDLTLVNRSMQELPPNYLNDPEQALDKALTRAVPGDALLTQAMLQEPQLVNKGQSVTIMAEGSSYAVKMPGTALANGAAGQRIGVRNSSSGRTVEAVVVDAGTVKVGL